LGFPNISKEKEISWSDIIDYYPIVWTNRSGSLSSPNPGKMLTMVALEYIDGNNGLPELGQEFLSPGDSITVDGDSVVNLTSGSGGICLLIIQNKIISQLPNENNTKSFISYDSRERTWGKAHDPDVNQLLHFNRVHIL
jgi:hypothetical protein